jgi:hypothetical protein
VNLITGDQITATWPATIAIDRMVAVAQVIARLEERFSRDIAAPSIQSVRRLRVPRASVHRAKGRVARDAVRYAVVPGFYDAEVPTERPAPSR